MKTISHPPRTDADPAGPASPSTSDPAPSPHEPGRTPGPQHEDHPRRVGRQAHDDLERGLKDTYRRGGDEYQQRTQNDAHANCKVRGKTRRGH